MMGPEAGGYNPEAEKGDSKEVLLSELNQTLTALESEFQKMNPNDFDAYVQKSEELKAAREAWEQLNAMIEGGESEKAA